MLPAPRLLLLALSLLATAALPTRARAQSWTPPSSFSFAPQAPARDDPDYRQGLTALDAHDWSQAITAFRSSATHRKSNADAALYWLAYAQNRAGQPTGALATLSLLSTRYPDSRWLRDARALRFEASAAAGSPLSFTALTDAHLQVMAVNNLMQSDPSAALPVVEKVLAGDDSEQVKAQALFVLSEHPSPQASRLLTQVATANRNPTLQIRAIQLMGMSGSPASRRSLSSLYTLSSDPRIKTAILRSSLLSGSPDLLLHAARTDLNPDLRAAAIGDLAPSPDQAPSSLLLTLFEKDHAPAVREAILNSLVARQDAPALLTLARTAKDPATKQQILTQMRLVHSPAIDTYLATLPK